MRNKTLSKKWFKRQLADWKFMSFDNKWKLVKCLFGFHEKYPSYCYPSCWVCGRLVFIEEHNKWIKEFNDLFGYARYDYVYPNLRTLAK